ncbi:MAG: metallophosphoesterase [Actinomycetota bacterium]
MTSTVRIAQLSDTHFLEDGEAPEGGHAYDTDEAFEAVADHLGGRVADHGELDLVVVTGDVADHGRPAQYRKAADAFARLQAPVAVCPGNHDFDVPFTAGIGRPGVSAPRAVEVGSWAFLFADSSAGMMEPGEHGLPVDPPGETRLHTNGSLGAREAAVVRQMYEQTTAEHVFIWLHHPPGVEVPMIRDDAYSNEWRQALADLDRVRGFGGGHTHIPDQYDFDGRPVFVAPSLKNNFSLEPRSWLPPGYRTYDFSPDGSVSSELHLVDDERWPRRPFGRALASLFNGELTYAELAEIAARRAG